MFFTSSDGYIRLTQEQLTRIELFHLISGLDDPDASSDPIVTGYTEWVSAMNDDRAAISVGWDWQLERGTGLSRLVRISCPRSNLMLKDNSKIDLGQFQTEIILASYVDSFYWQNDTLLHLKLTCANPARHPH